MSSDRVCHCFDTCRAPRYMGDGFVILHSNDVDIYYYYDQPGMLAFIPWLSKNNNH